MGKFIDHVKPILPILCSLLMFLIILLLVRKINESDFAKKYCIEKREVAEKYHGKKILEDDCHCLISVDEKNEQKRECIFEVIKFEDKQ